MNIILVQWDVNVIFHSQWGPRVMKEQCPCHSLITGILWRIQYPQPWAGGKSILNKINTVGFRRLLGSNGMSIWRSGYLLWKLTHCLQTQRCYHSLLACCEHWSRGDTLSQSFHLCMQGLSFSSKCSFGQLHFVLLGMYLLKCAVCWQTVLLWASLYASLYEHCQKEIFRLENCGLKPSLDLFISVLWSTKS